MDKLAWIERERTITERGVVLPFHLREVSSTYADGTVHVWREERSGEVFVPYEIFEALTDTGMLDRIVIHDQEVEQALEDAGLIHASVRGSVWATDELRALMEES